MTELQRRCFEFIRDRLVKTGIAPSYKEIQIELGVSSLSQAYQLVGRLVRGGYLLRVKGEARSIALPSSPHRRKLARRIASTLVAECYVDAASRMAVTQILERILQRANDADGGCS